MIRPHALKPGDTLGIAAPAGPVDRSALDAGIHALKSMGFNILLPDEIFSRSHYLAGPDQLRAKQLSRLFTDPDVDGIICARGGYGAMRILTLLDAAMLADHPKPFVGFSDITVLLHFLANYCGIVAFHGPTVTTLGSGDIETRDRFLQALTKKEPIRLSAKFPRLITPGQANGRFFCGNLTLFCHLAGTAFQPDFNGAIVLVEDQGEAPYRIDRMLTQMRLAGYFDHLAGLALGHFSRCGSENEIMRIVADRLGGLGIPICGGFGVGHEPDNATLPVGITVNLNADAGTLLFSEPALC